MRPESASACYRRGLDLGRAKAARIFGRMQAPET